MAEVLEETNETNKGADNASLADDGELPVDINGDSTTGKANSDTQFVINKGWDELCMHMPYHIAGKFGREKVWQIW